MEEFKAQSNQYDLYFKKYIKKITISVYSKENVIEKDNIEDLICPICFNILKNPISCSNKKNSHSFCKECIDEYLKENNKCPICKLNFEYIINNELNNILNKLSFECLYKNEGCKDILSYFGYLNHINKCKYNNIKYECNIKKYNYDKKEFEICGYLGNKTDIENHFNKCGLTKYKCLFCNINILQMDIEVHFTNKCKIKYEKNLDGDIYIGEKINNIKEGYGIYYFYNYRITYEGEFKNNMRDGYGIEYISDGNRYEGEFKDNKIEGYGFKYYSSGNIYIGEFKDFMKDGFGIYYNSYGDRYVGIYKNNKKEGFGIQYYSNGGKYIGIYKNDMRNGYGIEYNSNGNIYKGNFKDDNYEGYGILFLSDEKIYEGEFKNDELDGYAIIKFTDGKYEGEFKNGVIDGKGRLFGSYDIYEGEFENGKKDGYAIVYLPNGDRYEGKFINGIFNGYGIFYSHLGIQVKRYFKNDFSTKILYIIYKIILILNYLYSRLIKNKMTLLFIIFLIIGIIIN